jgi:hypothetical protein
MTQEDSASGHPDERRVSARHEAAAWVALATGIALVCTGVVGLFVSSSLRLVDSVFGHRLLVVLLGFGLIAVSSVLLTKPTWLRALAGFAGVVGALGSLAIAGVSIALGGGTEQVLAESSPSGDRTVVVKEGPNLVDVVYTIHVRTGGGLLEREWYVGCLSSDQRDQEISSARWIGDDVVVLQTRGVGPIRLTLDPETGKPQRVNLGYGC